MHFRFFGDSWFWNWNWSVPPGIEGVQSNEIQKLFDTSGDHAKNIPDLDRISFLRLYLEKLGHTVETFNIPGNPFTATVDIITSTAPDPQAVNIVFYSFDMRSNELKDFLHSNKKTPYKGIKNKIHFKTEQNLNRLGKFAVKTNQKFILAGGQGTLHKHVFNAVHEDWRTNLTLLSECILSGVQQRSKPFGIWKCCDAIGEEVGVEWEKMQDPELITRIHEDLDDWGAMNQKFTWPDTHHMSPAVTLLFLDWVFRHLDK